MIDDHPIDPVTWDQVLASIGASPGIVIAEPIGIGEGMLGQIYRIATDDASFVLKMVANGSSSVQQFEPCEREALTYIWLEQRWTLLEGTVPRFHHWEIECNGFQCLLLEDLTARGAKTRNPLVGLRPEEVRAGLVSIAKIHSVGSKMSAGRLVDQPPDQFLLTRKSLGLLDIIAQALASIEELLPSYYPTNKAERLVAILRDIPVPTVLEKAHGESRLIGFCHGDLWSNNILFVESSDGLDPAAVIVDWQFSTWGNPMVDPAFLITSSMAPAVRRSEEQSLLAAYYDALNDDIKVEAGYTFDSCLADYRSALVYGALMTLANFESYLAFPERSELPRLLDRFEAVAVEFFDKR